MRINEKSYLGVLFCDNDTIKDAIIKDATENKERFNSHIEWNKENSKLQEEALRELFNERGNKIFLITSTVLDMSSRLKLSDSIDFKIFNDIPDEKSTLLLDKNNMYRYMKKGSDIYVMKIVLNRETMWLDFVSFKIDTDTGKIGFNGNDESLKSVDEFTQILTFMKLAEVQIKILEAGGKSGTRKIHGYKNETDGRITIVDSNWNKYVIRYGDYGVRGHFRRQPYGPGLRKIKIIYINDFVKHQYIRKPKKNLHE